jgi:cytidine deaminase
MVDFSLTAADVELYEAARALLTSAHHVDRHRVAAAVRGASGEIYLGLHLGSKRVSICAESSAVANARIANEDYVSSVVAVCMNESGEPQVTNPCGVCRELMSTFGPAISVLVDVEGTVARAHLGELLPMPWMRAAENRWSVEAPRIANTQHSATNSAGHLEAGA